MRSIERALVLGGTGFLGTALVQKLEAEGIETLIIDAVRGSYQGKSPLIVSQLESVDLTSIIKAEYFGVVFHLATSAFVPPSLERPVEDLDSNAGSTVCVLEAVRNVRNPPVTVFASSAAVYGESSKVPMNEEHPIQPISPYGVSKRASELYLECYFRLYALPCFSIRMFSLYGPNQRKQIIYDLLVRLLKEENPLLIDSSPEVTRDFLYVEDAATSFLNLARAAPAVGEAYNLASGRATTLLDLANSLKTITRVEADINFTHEQRPGDPRFWLGDATKALALGATASTTLERGLGITAAWVKETLSLMPSIASENSAKLGPQRAD